MPKKASTPPAAAPAARPAHYKSRTHNKRRVYYSKALGEDICERLAAGERWHAMAGGVGMPSHTAPYKWRDKYPAFGKAFRLAMQVGANTRADQVLDVAESATSATVTVDRLHIGALKWHVERDTKMYGPRPDEPDLGAGRALIIEVRQFERVVRADGTAHMQEILPSGEVIDLD